MGRNYEFLNFELQIDDYFSVHKFPFSTIFSVFACDTKLRQKIELKFH